MTVRIFSYGSKFAASVPGHVKEEDTYDCTVLPNPWHRPEFRVVDGTNFRVKAFVEGSQGFRAFMDPIIDTLADGKTYAFYCVGGMHRSVVCAEAMARAAHEAGLTYKIEHRRLCLGAEG